MAILCYGTILENAREASKILEEKHNIKITIADARFAKPIDQQLVLDLAKNHKLLITLEDGVIGGFVSVVAQFLLNEGMMEKPNFKFRSLFMKDQFIEQNSISAMQDEAGIGIGNIVGLVVSNQ